MKLKKQFSLISLITILMLGFGTVNAQEQNLQDKMFQFRATEAVFGLCQFLTINKYVKVTGL